MTQADRYRWSVRTVKITPQWVKGVRHNRKTIRTKYFDDKVEANKYAHESRGQGLQVSLRPPELEHTAPQQNPRKAQ